MFADARSVENNTQLSTDLCIVGGGAAGIALALGVSQAGFSTVLLEAGGTEYDEASQAVYKGVVKSDVLVKKYLTRSRLRYFGGTTNHWGGHSVVINPNIFRARPGIPGGEWPISAEDLRPYYKRAAELLGMRRPVPDQRVSLVQSELVPVERYPVGRDKFRMGQAYYDQIKRSNVQVLLNASVTAINPNPSGQRIRNVTVQTLAGNKFSVRARTFVLATGAIENARLLLLPTEVNDAGIGNNHDLVGRNFSDHLWGHGRLMETSPPWDYNRQAFHTIVPQLQDEYALPELGILRRKKGVVAEKGDEVISTIAKFGDGSAESHLANLVFYVEVLPDPENRVLLSRERDPFGNPKVELRFQFTSQMRERYAASVELFGRIAGRHGIGRVQLLERRPGAGFHHMNTTPMSNDPKRGVVDANGKVHGVSNIFVAGSSVFPSSGCGNPTFPLIALTARLVDHLVEAFKNGKFD